MLSTYPNGQYARLDGTSMATPHISGLIALYKSLGKEIDISKAENKILTAK
ncbi:S8 family serine peptidase [Salmonella enterica]|uniref:S8 family serine peptidase n=1 Tax=Salmonella enterica TaxID=28901 RepID=UPI0034E01E40